MRRAGVLIALPIALLGGICAGPGLTQESPGPIIIGAPPVSAAHKRASDQYAAQLLSIIKSKLVAARQRWGNQLAGKKTLIKVRLTPSGKVVSRSIGVSAGIPEWDAAVLKAVDQSSPFPPPPTEFGPPGQDFHLMMVHFARRN